MNKPQLNELLYQALETEMGGVRVYTTALECVVNDDLKEEWEKYLDQTKNHEQVVRNLFGKLSLDPEQETPGREVVRHLGEGLVKAMKMAQQAGHPKAAELVACECVVLAETKGSSELGITFPVRGKSERRSKESAAGSLRRSRRPERRAHLSH